MFDIKIHKEQEPATLIQPSLEIGKEDDEQEKEANEVAGKVMRMSDPNAENVGKMHTGLEKVQPMTDPNAANVGTMHTGFPPVRMMSTGNSGGMNAPANVEKGITSSKGYGEDLANAVQEEMGAKMGADFSGVKVHTDNNAVEMNKEIGAKAFTHGNDIYFNQGQYNPTSNTGKHLLAHELTHTVQQGTAAKGVVQRQTAGTLPDFPGIAKTIYDELDSTNTDEDLIYSELEKLQNNVIYIQCLTESYRTLYHVSISAALQGELDDDEVPKALELLTPSSTSNQKYIRGEWMEIKSYSKATTFKDLVVLMRIAEDILISNGYYDMNDRVQIIRGIFYGTTWSMDYEQEQSEARNLGFDLYTASTSRPVDPTKMLGLGLFNAIKQTTEITDNDRQIDVGHLIIGLESRSNATSREVKIAGQGGTGLEAVTWLGDLGGGVGMTAMKRADGNQVTAKSVVFNASGHDYGSTVNLEGDIAAYVVARDTDETDDPAYPKIDDYGYISDALADFLLTKNNKPSSEWDQRVKNFALMIGAEFDTSNTMTNKDEFIEDISDKFIDFGDTYAFVRLSSHKQLTKEKALNTSKNLKGAATEVAKIFADMLEQCAKDSSKKAIAYIDPAVSAIGDPESGLLYDYYKMVVLGEKINDYLKK